MRQFVGYDIARYPRYAGLHMQTPARLIAPLYKTAVMPQPFLFFVPVGRSVVAHALFQ